MTLRAEGCGQARGFRLVETLPQWGAVHVEARGESTANPYPADGQRFQVSLGAGGYVKLTNVTVASCDEVEARALTGEVLWRWKPAAAWAKAWSGRLSGDVEVGIWGEGCNATEKKGGFTLAEVRLEEAASAPLPLGLPGQKQRPDGTWDNWHRTYMAEVGRYPAPEPLLQDSGWLRDQSGMGFTMPIYAHVKNSPARQVDPTGLYSWRMICPALGVFERGFALQKTLFARRWIPTPGSVGLEKPQQTACQDLEIAKAAREGLRLQRFALLAESCWDALITEIEAECRKEERCAPRENDYPGKMHQSPHPKPLGA